MVQPRGLKQASKDNTYAYVEDGVAGRPIYENSFLAGRKRRKLRSKEYGLNRDFELTHVMYEPRAEAVDDDVKKKMKHCILELALYDISRGHTVHRVMQRGL